MDRVSMMYGIRLEEDSNSSPSPLDKNASPHRLIDNTRDHWSWKPLDSYLQPMTELSAFSKQSFQWALDVYQDSTLQHNTPSTLANRHGSGFNFSRSAESAHGDSVYHNFGVNFGEFKSYTWKDQISSDFMRLPFARAAGLKTLFNHDIVDNFMNTLAAYSNDSTMAVNQFDSNETQQQCDLLPCQEPFNAPLPPHGFDVQPLNSIDAYMFNSLNDISHFHIDTVTVDSFTVAQIVGKNSVKIKELAIKYNTIVRYPKEGEVPVFEIRGERNAVQAVKQEILKWANRFMALEMSRMNQLHILANRTGQSLSKLYVPLLYAGLMAGTKCCYVRLLQDIYNVFIQTPSPELQIEHFLILGKQADIDKVIDLLWIQLYTKARRSFRKKRANENEVHFTLISPTTSSTMDTIALV